MIVGTIRESYPGERRVALVPKGLGPLQKAGIDILVENDAGLAAGIPDAAYREKGARLAGRAEVLRDSDVLLQVRTLGANPEHGSADLASLQSGATVIGLAEPLTAFDAAKQYAERGVNLFALELIPRITRAQSMDVLSSMATIAGYKAALISASRLPKMFPMMMTAAGTITPAKVFIIGAGVAGLQAIASCRRLGAQVSAYDLRPAVREQVESLGAKFVQMDLESEESETAGGYAKEMNEEFYRRQRELMGEVIAESDVAITTAAIPGKTAPRLITSSMVERMAPGSVIVDLAAVSGGNCELTRPDETVEHRGVTILGPTNLAAEVPFHASQMYAKNVTTFLDLMLEDGKLDVDKADEILEATRVTGGGEIVNARIRELMGAQALTT